ncbi:uncharacterized protein LOC112503306 [Cynara cardunculus var. scolymus]|uniref:uncharacterized protein LOC112503306 n=1 Tax=Cynara cardunculus var. scolymus TaxID=59895 RepID=UPI000D62D4B9|nr:uncharacterized protein LOC112503306 [Cynara cardunculus var. scolymus]
MDTSSMIKNHVEKPEKFKGTDFRRWQRKMLFYLTTLHVSNVLMDDEPRNPPVSLGQNVPTAAQTKQFEKAVETWKSNEYNCRNYILNALDDSLYDIYSTFKTAREIWESLERKYKTKVACSKRFVVGKFLHYKMIDSKLIVKQVEELQVITHELEVEGMGINSNFMVGFIIKKLPPSWKNFKLYLKHLTDDMSFEQLVLKLRVEEDNRLSEKADASCLEPNENMVALSTSKGKFQKFKGKGIAPKPSFKNSLAPQKKNFKRAKDCRHKRDHGGGGNGGGGAGPSHQANMANSETQFIGMVEANLVTNTMDRWFDTRATKHICNTKGSFATYQKVSDEELMSIGNTATAKVEGKGKMILKLTSRKDLVLTNVLHVPDIRKNLISGPMLSNKGFKIVFESNKFVITKGGLYVHD